MAAPAGVNQAPTSVQPGASEKDTLSLMSENHFGDLPHLGFLIM